MLQFLDVSSYIHAGMKTEFGARAQYKGVPTGGIYGILQQIAICIREDNIPVLCFDSRTNLKEILPEYKGSRSRNPKVRFQQDIVYRYIYDCIPNSFKIEGYEADSIAYNVAEQNRGKIKDGMIYRTTDYDWCHNIVDSYDIMKPAVKGYMEIHSDNFEKVFSCKYYKTPLNSITAMKVFFGDNSDSVSPMPFSGVKEGEDAQKIRAKFFTAYNIYCNNNKLDIRSKNSMLEFADKFKSHFGDNYDYLLRRIRVLYPQEIDNKEQFTISMKPINIQGLSKVCSLTGCKSIANRLGIPYYEDMGAAQQELFSLYRDRYLVEKTELFENKLVKPKESDSVIPNRGGFIL